MKALVIGLGSIGNRHYQNLKDLGIDVDGVDIEDPIDESIVYDFVVIASPTNTHVSIANRYLSINIPCFIEKPLAESIEQLERLNPSKTINMVACNIRFTPQISEIKKVSNSIINIHSRVCDSGSYRSKYGDIILQDIHEFDYLSWLMGEIKHIDVIRSSNGKAYDALILFESGRTASLHGDMETKAYHRSVFYETRYGSVYESLDIGNKMYIDQMKYFIECVIRNKMPENNIDYSIRLTRRILEAIDRMHYPGKARIEETVS